MGQKTSRPAEEAPSTISPPPPAPKNEYPPSGRILPGAYIIRNRASGTVLHLIDPSEYEISTHCEVVGWTQESACVDKIANQTWWVEWDEVYKSYVFTNVTRGVVLDVVGSIFSSPGKKSGADKEKEKVVCARPRVRNLASARSSIKSSRRSSVDFIQREDLKPAGKTADGSMLPLTEEVVVEKIMSQRWILKRTHPTSESFSIHNLQYANITLDLDWGKVDNNTKIQLRTKTGVNHQQWNFIIPTPPSMTPPIGSWIVFRNRKTDHFLHHADRDYPPAPIRIPKPQWEGIGSKREYWGLQWCFIRVKDDNNSDVRWYIKNRLTGTLLEHYLGRRKGDSVRADSHLLGEAKTWRAHLLASGSETGGQTGVWAFENAESGCVLDHHSGKSIQCYTPGVVNPYRQWKIMEASTPFVDHGAANLTPPPEHIGDGRAFPTLSMSCTLLNAASYPSNTSLIPLIMPSAESFHYVEPTMWPFPACAPASRDVLGHEERSFFELLSRIETQLLIAGQSLLAQSSSSNNNNNNNNNTSRASSRPSSPSIPGTPTTESPPPSPRPRSMSLTMPLSGFFDFSIPQKPGALADTASIHSTRSYKSSTSTTSSALLFLSTHPNTTKKRILQCKEGWTSWAFGYSDTSGTMTHWNNLVESEVVRAADRRDRYIVCFYEAVVVIRDLLERVYERQSALLDASGRGGEGVVVLPGRVVWLVLLAGMCLERVARLRRVQVDMAEERAAAMGMGLGMGMGMGSEALGGSVGVRGAREVNEWVIGELERVRVGWGAVERMCAGKGVVIH